MLRKRILGQETLQLYMDVCFYDSTTATTPVVSKEEWHKYLYPADRYTPIGIVVVPASHGMYGDYNTCAIVSLKYMSCSTPDTGTLDRNFIYYGQYASVGSDTPLSNWLTIVDNGTLANPTDYVTGYSSGAHYLPSDIYKGTVSLYDTTISYPVIIMTEEGDYPTAPPPYLTDGSSNPDYRSLTETDPYNNALADMSGFANTVELLDLVTEQPDWKTDSTIIKEYGIGYSPAACCCWRYSTPGTRQGDWYVPSCGEVGYIATRTNAINKTVATLQKVYGDDCAVGLSLDYELMSSTKRHYYWHYTYSYSFGYMWPFYNMDGIEYVRALAQIRV